MKLRLMMVLRKRRTALEFELEPSTPASGDLLRLETGSMGVSCFLFWISFSFFLVYIPLVLSLVARPKVITVPRPLTQ